MPIFWLMCWFILLLKYIEWFFEQKKSENWWIHLIIVNILCRFKIVIRYWINVRCGFFRLTIAHVHFSYFDISINCLRNIGIPWSMCYAHKSLFREFVSRVEFQINYVSKRREKNPTQNYKPNILIAKVFELHDENVNFCFFFQFKN